MRRPAVWVARPGALGDALLTLPALRALRHAGPDATLVFAGHAAAGRLLARAGEVDHALPFDDPSLGWLFGGTGTPPEGLEGLVLYSADPDGALRARLERAIPGRAVVAASRPADDGVHCAAHLLAAVAPLAGPLTLDARAVRLAVPARPSDEVLLHPGSGSPRKNWPAERFAEVVSHLAQAGAAVRLVVGEADGAAAAAVDTALGRPLPRLDRPTLDDLAAQLAGCRAYLGNDSGVSHLAGLVGAPTFALFGPTPPAMWAPLGPKVQVLPFESDPSEVAAVVLATLRAARP